MFYKSNKTNFEIRINENIRNSKSEYFVQIDHADWSGNYGKSKKVFCLDTRQVYLSLNGTESIRQEGDNLLVTCTYANTTRLVWVKDGNYKNPIKFITQIYDRRRTVSLELFNLTKKDEGVYTCAVENDNAISKSFILRIGKI